MKRSTIDIFKAEVSKMIGLLNLGDWDVSVKQGAVPVKDEANIFADPDCRVARITVSRNITPDEHNVRKVARHECWHLFLANYRTMARNRFVTEAELDREEERICTVMEKVEV